jgi:hypothetical protein
LPDHSFLPAPSPGRDVPGTDVLRKRCLAAMRICRRSAIPCAELAASADFDEERSEDDFRYVFSVVAAGTLASCRAGASARRKNVCSFRRRESHRISVAGCRLYGNRDGCRCTGSRLDGGDKAEDCRPSLHNRYEIILVIPAGQRSFHRRCSHPCCSETASALF